MNTHDIELNEQFKKALDIMENTGKNIFITGKAGTGKSTLLDYFRSATRKKIVVLAPTGVAALNVQGETIHSFFGFKPDITLQKVKKINGKKAHIYKKVEAVIIDEISMVRADLLDCVDRFLRLNGKDPRSPFGGIQMIFIGDLYQLPPVVKAKEKEIFRTHYGSPYFFDADLFKNFSMEYIELEKVYRQKDEKFIKLLNSIRNNSIMEEELALLNERVGAEYPENKKDGFVINLTTTNKMAHEINTRHLQSLKTTIHSYKADISGNFEKYSYPTEPELQIGVGAQVMLLNNDPGGRWVNGSVGKIAAIEQDKENDADAIFIQLSDGGTEEVIPYTWEIFHFSFNGKKQTIESETVGSFTQYPLKLAWAITIHKSQGKTFDKVIIDMGFGSFAHGQTYVALSRCTSLDGILLKKPVKKSHILMDRRVVKFLTRYQYAISEANMSLHDKIAAIKQAIEKNVCLEILYLKPTDEKSKRIIRPLNIGEKIYLDKTFLGVEAYCMERRESRTFRVDRILEMRPVDKPF